MIRETLENAICATSRLKRGEALLSLYSELTGNTVVFKPYKIDNIAVTFSTRRCLEYYYDIVTAEDQDELKCVADCLVRDLEEVIFSGKFTSR